MSHSFPVVPDGGGRRFDALGAPVYRLIHPMTVGSVGLGVSICVMEPGQVIRRHRHAYEEAYYVLEGTGVMNLEDSDDIQLAPGISIYIAAGRYHGQRNDGGGILRILCSLAPPPVEGEATEFDPGDTASAQ